MSHLSSDYANFKDCMHFMNIYVYDYRPQRLISLHFHTYSNAWSISTELVFFFFPLKGQTETF